jgi:hypothetical protein
VVGAGIGALNGLGGGPEGAGVGARHIPATAFGRQTADNQTLKNRVRLIHKEEIR